jgi:hypothetical protein
VRMTVVRKNTYVAPTPYIVLLLGHGMREVVPGSNGRSSGSVKYTIRRIGDKAVSRNQFGHAVLVPLSRLVFSHRVYASVCI